MGDGSEVWEGRDGRGGIGAVCVRGWGWKGPAGQYGRSAHWLASLLPCLPPPFSLHSPGALEGQREGAGSHGEARGGLRMLPAHPRFYGPSRCLRLLLRGGRARGRGNGCFPGKEPRGRPRARGCCGCPSGDGGCRGGEGEGEGGRAGPENVKARPLRPEAAAQPPHGRPRRQGGAAEPRPSHAPRTCVNPALAHELRPCINPALA